MLYRHQVTYYSDSKYASALINTGNLTFAQEYNENEDMIIIIIVMIMRT